MRDLMKLRAEISTDPLSRGYAGMNNAQLAHSLNTANLPTGPRDMSLGELNKAIDNMADASGVPAWELIKAGAGIASGTQEEVSFGIACRAALHLLRDARADYPGVNTRSPMFTANIDVLVAGNALTVIQGSELKAMSDALQSRAQELGLGIVTASEVARARS